MARVALVYAADDVQDANALHRGLAAAGYEVDRNPPPAALAKALDGADRPAVVVLWSASSGSLQDTVALAYAKDALVLASADRRTARRGMTGAVNARPTGFSRYPLIDLSRWTGAADAPAFNRVTARIDAVHARTPYDAGAEGGTALLAARQAMGLSAMVALVATVLLAVLALSAPMTPPAHPGDAVISQRALADLRLRTEARLDDLAMAETRLTLERRAQSEDEEAGAAQRRRAGLEREIAVLERLSAKFAAAATDEAPQAAAVAYRQAENAVAGDVPALIEDLRTRMDQALADALPSNTLVPQSAENRRSALMFAALSTFTDMIRARMDALEDLETRPAALEEASAARDVAMGAAMAGFLDLREAEIVTCAAARRMDTSRPAVPADARAVWASQACAKLRGLVRSTRSGLAQQGLVAPSLDAGQVRGLRAQVPALPRTTANPFTRFNTAVTAKVPEVARVPLVLGFVGAIGLAGFALLIGLTRVTGLWRPAPAPAHRDGGFLGSVVYLSHARSEASAARVLGEELEHLGLTPLVDETGGLRDRRWASARAGAVGQTKATVLAIGRGARSDECLLRDAAAAEALGRPLILFRVDGTEPSPAMAALMQRHPAIMLAGVPAEERRRKLRSAMQAAGLLETPPAA